MRLCALSVAGELTAEEEARLGQHLSECEDCRKACAEFDNVVSDVLPALGAEIVSESNDDLGAEAWSLKDAQQRLLKAVDEEAFKRTVDSNKRPAKERLVGIVVLIGSVATASVLSYRVGIKHAHLVATPGAQSAIEPAPIATANSIPVPPSGASLRRQRNELLENQIAVEKQKSFELLAQLRATTAKLNQETESLSEAVAERDHARLDVSAQQATLQTLQARLDEASKQPVPDFARAQDLEARLNSQDRIIAAKDATIAQQAELLQHDRDIRNLMSARDLYIAEIYDVAKDGATQKPFGRVFYTRDKSLIFYGFDLDRQPHVTQTSVFQAWGRQDTSNDVSLGLLYQDEASKNRWVLKFNDPSTLARLDAVFVTIEPKGGSSKPTGKPLLFAYLRMAPNHP